MGSFLPLAMSCRPLSTRKSPKKNGDCSRIGRQDCSGLVPVRLYRSIVSAVIACRESGSVLPLYFAWIFCISGWMSCSRREAWICRTNSGIIAARITTTSPTIDMTHAKPEAGGMPMKVSALCQPYRIQATIHSNG